jgi:hypothetical protein
MHYLAWLIFIVLCVSQTLSQVNLVRVKRYYPSASLKQNKLTMIVWLLDSIYLTYYYFGM